jgi:Flp pilus assembly protein TadD
MKIRSFFRPVLQAVAAGLIGVAVAGCASRPPPPDTQPLLRDELVAPPTSPVRTDHVFALSAEMRSFLDSRAPTIGHSRDPRVALLEALYKPGELLLRYDSASTRNAAEAFAARAGNCLSLVIMTASMARHLGLPVTFQHVVTEDSYQRVGNLVLASGHVNLVFGRVNRSIGLIGRAEVDALTVDFLPREQLGSARSWPIEERTVLAMYMNNRAAELLTEGRTVDAYWHAREAVRTDPGFAAAINTLGVIYRNLGLPGPAEQALRQVLVLQPAHQPALGNLARVLEETGRRDEGAAVRAQLAALQPYAPFHFFDLGRKALAEGRADEARTLFERELEQLPHQPMVLAWLAQAHQQLGRADRAARAMAQAVEYSVSLEQRDIYSAKLAALRAAGARL